MRNILILGIAFMASSCVDPLDFNIDNEVNILIVEGAITTQPGSHWIRLTRSAKYGNIFEGFVQPVIKAEVKIRDSDGISFSLTEEIFSFFDPLSNRTLSFNTGVYRTTNTFAAVVNKSYTLLITTPNGTEYTSLPEKIIVATEIGGLQAEFSNVPLLDDEFITGFNIYATFQDPPEERNFFMWKNYGEYLPEFYGEDLPRRPLDISIQLVSDNFSNGNLITDQVAFIKEDCVRLNSEFLVRIEQHSLTREAFQFFQLLQEQTSIDGDIFDPPPATLRGNMINLTNPDEPVIGYFRASDVSLDSIYIIE